ncbi:E3 ubiquitin-protein ligase ATL31 [Ziziphus jujuba]|uniref:RING-type E3 ubiquitin transferase n=1 Tax=Ziziphus jujuba TaxID=326968 RepID=A0A6P3ZJD0_ZIZJJ|nr:E3 ubiquitin-protein ligase ATL31 [Ziziphus jujuba]
MSSGDQKSDRRRLPELRQLRLTNAAVKHEILTLLSLLLLLPDIPFAGAQSNPNDNRNDPYQYNQFTPSMAIIIVVLIAALFFMGFVSIYIRHCNDGQSTGNSVRVIGGAGRSRRSRGLERTVIDSFPTFAYSSVKAHKIGKGALECAVCLNEFEEEDTLRLIPKCDHVFHPECVDAWLENHTTCPVCRAQLSPQPDEVVQPDGSPIGLSADVEAQNDDVTLEPGVEQRERDEQQLVSETDPEVLDLRAKLNRNRTRGSRSSRTRRFFFPRSHSTGHSLVQPGENLDRFTLKLPVEVRKQILNRKLHRATSLVVLPREGSSRLGYRNGGDGGSNRGSRSSKRLDSSVSKSDRWVFSMTPPFFMRMSSLKSPKVAASEDHGEGTSSAQPVLSGVLRSDSVRPPV